jgi:hypothetical protein
MKSENLLNNYLLKWKSGNVDQTYTSAYESPEMQTKQLFAQMKVSERRPKKYLLHKVNKLNVGYDWPAFE